MEIIQTPIKVKGIEADIYAGLGPRIASFLLDALIISPWGFLLLYINSLEKNFFFYTIVPGFLFGIWYNIYLVKKYGGTPGKLIMGMKIIKLNSKPIEWKEAFLRHSVSLVFSLLSLLLTTVCLLKADENIYNSLSWLKRMKYLMSLAPVLFTVYSWLNNIWVYSEFIVLLTNPRKRALHDYIAGTVIIKKDYIDQIKEAMLPIDTEPDGADMSTADL